MKLRFLFCMIALLIATNVSTAQDKAAKRILAKFDEMRPSEEELAMYRLDWADSLEHALDRAKSENRPIVLVIIHAKYGDITSGHC